MRLFFSVLLLLFVCGAQAQRIAGTLRVGTGVYQGYTLFAPLNAKQTYLIDNCGRVINVWTSNFFPGNTFYLMSNGNLVRAKRVANTVITGGGGGGGVEMFDWSGNLLWSFDYNSEVARLHHDIALLPNGNILVLAWVLKTREEALAAGRKPDLLVDDVIWSEELLEIKPVLPDGFQIVWKWELWDHLVQDYDLTKQNYGVVEEHPELVNLNYTMGEGIDDWIHANAIDYNPAFDQILISSPFLNEFWIIDHSTSTEQAASHAGGTSNRGGDLLYRWGNPEAYKKGTDADQKIFGQHHVHWIDQGLPFAGKIMLFNNNAGLDYSTVSIIDPPVNAQNTYDLSNGVFGPQEPLFTYTASPPQTLFSRIMSGAEMLPNGNILICSSLQGKIFEVDSDQEIVWEYRIPVTGSGIIGRDYNPPDSIFASDPSFRALKYPITFQGFAGKNMQPGEPIEGEPWLDCLLVTAVEDPHPGIQFYPNPVRDLLVIKSANAEERRITAFLMGTDGREILSAEGFRELRMDVSDMPTGFYVLRVNNKSYKIWKN